MYEAICSYEGLQLIEDYLNMCNILNMKPRIDGDSLKREHDITARMCREKRNEILAEKMANISKSAHDFDYAEDIFFVKALTDYDELIDEAKQQHNCVASYAERIANGKTRIWVARECAHPESSLATLEPTSDMSGFRQKLLAYNAPIRNKALTEFLDRAIDHAKRVEQGEISPMKIEIIDEKMQQVSEKNSSISPIASSKDSVQDWYMSAYSDDSLGINITSNISFENVYNEICNGNDLYSVLGVGDSVVRERVFNEISTRLDIEYEEIYEKWLLDGQDYVTPTSKTQEETVVEEPKMIDILPSEDEGFGTPLKEESSNNIASRIKVDDDAQQVQTELIMPELTETIPPAEIITSSNDLSSDFDITGIQKNIDRSVAIDKLAYNEPYTEKDFGFFKPRSCGEKQSKNAKDFKPKGLELKTQAKSQPNPGKDQR